MNSQTILEFTQQALLLSLILSLPCVLVAAVVGFLVSIFQAVTQMQDQNLSLAIKLIAVYATLLISAGWMATRLHTFSSMLFAAAGAPP